MNASQLIDKQIASLSDWRADVFIQLRKTVNEVGQLTEEWKWDTAAWSHNGMVCAVGVFKDHVKINFFKGAMIIDSKKLFNAGLEAKKSRSIDFFQGDAIPVSDLKNLIRAAIAENVAKK
jgi:hypothetical protein